MVQPQNQIRILPPGTLSIKKRQTLALSEGENVSNGVTEEKKRDNKSGMSGAKFVSSESLSREGKNKECNLIKQSKRNSALTFKSTAEQHLHIN